MDVFVTVDTECTEERLVGGQVWPPLGYDVMMRGRVGGHDRHGLGTDLIVSELGKYGFRATFFVESLCAGFFGVQGLADVCADLAASGQDIQLHLHPNFRRPEWRRSGGTPLPDNIGEYTVAEQAELLSAGLRLLAGAGVPRRSLVAFRAGNYGASNHTWQALKQVGLEIDSSLNLSCIGGDCLIVPDRPRIDVYEALPGVWELPVSCFQEGRGYRHLEITAITAREMERTLLRLRDAGARTATIVTHPGEFFVVDDPRTCSGRPNRINIARLRKLLAFLDSRRAEFAVKTVAELAGELRISPPAGGHTPAAAPSGSVLLRAARLPVQMIKRLSTRRRQPLR